MPLVHCPHCGAENFTMEGWEDLDHCASCGKPLGEPVRDRLDATRWAATRCVGESRRGSECLDAKKPRRA